MRKLFFILALTISVSCYAVDTTKSVKSVLKLKIENIDTAKVKQLKSQIVYEADSLLKDSAFRQQLFNEFQNFMSNKPEQGSDTTTWLYWFIGLFITLLGSFVASMPTIKSYWWLQPVQVVIRFIWNKLLAPKNKNTDNGSHNI